MKKRRRASITKFLIWACVATFLQVNYMHVAEASSSNNGSSSSGNAPFMVMSEITVQSDDGNVQSSDVLGENQNDGGGTTANGNDASSVNNGESNSSSIDIHKNESGGNINQETGTGVGGSSGSGSDTDGEDEDKLLGNHQEGDNISAGFVHNASGEPLLQPPTNSVTASVDSSTEANAASQPLRTLKRLQAMLDDSDYATHTVAPDSATVIASDVTNEVIENVSHNSNSHTDPPPIQQAAVSSSSTNPPPPNHNINNNPMSGGPEKLWTSKDRAKYRRTRRTEKQRQQQREYEEQHARKIRDIQRQRIIREERERKELEELRLKRAEVMKRQQRYEDQQKQQQLNQFMHYNDGDNTDFTDDDTDTDGGKGFDLPNLPVYLSDGEATDDFSEETEESAPKMMHRRSPIRPSSNYPPPSNNSRQRGPYQRPPLPQNMAQHHYQNAQQIPPQTNIGTYQNYQQQQQQYPSHSQPQQPMSHQQQYQYNGQSNNNANPQQSMQENHQRQYDQQYAAWAQAASNGYYYPPPPQLPPTAASFQQAQVLQQSQQQAQQQQHPSYPQQYPYQNQHGGHPYHTQQQVGEQSSSNPNPYASILPQPFVPRRTDNNMSQGSEQQRFYNRENEGIEEWQSGQQQSQDQFGSQSTSSGSEATLNFPAQPIANQDNEVTATSETSTPTTTSTSTNNGQMGVQSAFVVPPQRQSASPLISLPSSSSREAIVAPINAEGPYCELVDETVSFLFTVFMTLSLSRIFF